MRYGPEFVGLLARAMSQRLEGVSISKIEGGSDWIILHTRYPGIFISWNQESFGVSMINPPDRLRFGGMSASKGGIVLALSKHLTGAKIRLVSQYKNDRILTISFSRYIGAGIAASHTLLVELMGRLSNLILLNEDGVIVECAKHVHPEINRYRSVLPGQEYVPPPPMDGISPKALEPDGIRNFLENPLGIGKPLSSGLLWAISNGISGNTEVLKGLRSLLNGQEPLKVQSLDGYITAWPWLLPGAQEETEDITEILNACSFRAMVNKKRQQLIKKGLKSIQKEQRGIQRHIDGLKKQLSMTAEAKKLRMKGQAILAGARKIPPGATLVRLPCWDEAGNRTFVDIELNPSLDPSKNAEFYFKKYKKFNADPRKVLEKIEGLNLQMEELSVEADILENMDDLKILRDLVGDRTSETPGAGKKKKETAPPHLRYAMGESLVLAGLNERGNRYVTFKQASAEDIWFHVHEMPGSHVILKSPAPGWEESPILEFCASLALFYSKGSSLDRASVDYTEKKHVRAIRSTGPAHVTYKNSRSLSVSPRMWRELLQELKADPEEENS